MAVGGGPPLPAVVCSAALGVVSLGAPPTSSAKVTGTGRRIALAIARFNEEITAALAAGAIEALTAHEVARADIHEFYVPGSYELPLTAQALAQRGTYDAVICVGCLIRGDTPHFEYISGAVSQAIMQVGLDTGVPVIFGVLTTNTIEQAQERARPGPGNKGAEAALAALEMCGLLASIAS